MSRDHPVPLRPARRVALAAPGALTAGLAAASAALASGHAIGGGHYTGKTTQHAKTSITVANNGRKITKLHTAVSYDGLCGNGGGGPAFRVNAANVPIQAGSFSVTVKARAAAGTKPLQMIVTGSFTGKTVNGTVAERNGHCPAPKQVENPYLTTFKATA